MIQNIKLAFFFFGTIIIGLIIGEIVLTPLIHDEFQRQVISVFLAFVLFISIFKAGRKKK